jgi:hypothetical protein
MARMKGRRFLRTIARYTVALLLFAQGALVAEACLRLDATPQAAFSASQMEGCEMGTDNPNACLLAYLDQSDYSSAQATVFPATAYIIVSQASQPPAAAPRTQTALPPPGCAPPIPIRYCSLLI